MDRLVIGVGGTRFRQKLEQLSLQQQYSLSLFQRADETIFYILQHPPQLIVADYRLPDIDGLSFLCRVRRISPDSLRVLHGVDASTQRLTSAALNLFACIDAAVDVATLATILNKALPPTDDHSEKVLPMKDFLLDRRYDRAVVCAHVSTQLQ
ncbi:MAG: hypothetical protein JXA04_07445 [Gammaproteobacteria bacterium]|nr:hypothetical protein [Gammaproteobacteria bacterium]